jgi:hypothetical protein
MMAMRLRALAFAWVGMAELGQVGWASGPRSGWAPARRPAVSETMAAYRFEEEAGGGRTAALPAAVAAEMDRVDAMDRAIVTAEPILQWRFESVRAGYQAILRRAGDNPAVEAALRDRLARVTRHEQAAQAARTIETILARSQQRDAEVAGVRQRLAAAQRTHARAYSAMGLVQPSSRMVEGRKLHALIGADGATLAYLDIPPGVDLDPLLSRRVGVRGASHYNPDLGARLITVRDLEALESRR